MLDGDLAWALAIGIHYEWEEHERALLAPLVDATIMRVETDALEAIAQPILEVLWEELRPLLAGTLEAQAKQRHVVADALDDALGDLELGPRRSRLANAVLQQAAVDLADQGFFLDDCLDCLENGLTLAPPERRRELVQRAAAALALHGSPGYGVGRPGDEERESVRAHVRRMAELGRESLPKLAPAVAELAAGPLPPPGQDAVLHAVLRRRWAAAAHRN